MTETIWVLHTWDSPAIFGCFTNPELITGFFNHDVGVDEIEWIEDPRRYERVELIADGVTYLVTKVEIYS